MACTPWLAPSVRYRKSGLQGYPSLSSIPCHTQSSASGGRKAMRYLGTEEGKTVSHLCNHLQHGVITPPFDRRRD